MAKEICISSTPHETRLAILEDDQLAEIYYERENEYTLAGSIYNGRVTRVLPGMQSAFVDLGLERDAFLYVTDFVELEDQEDTDEIERAASTGGNLPPHEVRHGGESRGQDSREGRRDRGDDRRREQGRDQGRPSHAPREIETPAAIAGDSHPVVPELETQNEETRGSAGGKRWRGRRHRRGRGPMQGSAELESSEGGQVEFEEKPVAESDIADEIQASEAPQHPPRAQQAPAPFVLPGESLRKYGGTGAEDAKSPTETAAPKPSYTSKPSTLIESPLEWDGSGLLPGESRSRRRQEPAEVAETPAVEPGESEGVEQIEKVSNEAIEMIAPSAGEFAEEEFAEEEQVEEYLLEEELVEEDLIEEEHPRTHEESAPPALREIESAPHSPAQYHRHEEHHEALRPPVEEERRVVFEEETSRSDESAPAAAEISAAQELRGTAHHQEVTAAGGTGPTHEGPTEAEPQADAEAGHNVDPASPLEFRLFGFGKKKKDEEAVAVEDQPAAPAKVASVSAYAPGEGVVEEEVIEGEEYEAVPHHRRHKGEDHGLETFEEEQLPQHLRTGDLGEMLQEAHLDHKIQLNLGDQNGEEVEYDTDEEDEEQESAAGTQPAPGQPRRDTRDRGRRGRQQQGRRGPSRRSMQTTDLPVISDLLKPNQEILVQIAKEPIAKKGARITSHIALPGRFLVFMPTVSHVGVSRKIASDEERHRLKRILLHERGEASGGFIVRTAAEGASEEELRADLRFLLNLWADIKQRSEGSKSPALIYHDLGLIERILRDQVNDNFSNIWVDSEADYERIVRFLNRFSPTLVRRVKLYTKETPLFEHFGIQDEISKALRSKVWLKSGGSIVINQTEALVAIDINTGKYVGKSARLEDTIVKTNLDAVPEIVRQIRLRDLGGIIVIDFIDMDERKNRFKVLAALEEALKADRAPTKVLQFNDFGLVAITRKRVKQSLERTLSVPCPTCQATGMVKSPATVCNEIYVELRKMRKHFEGADVMLRVNPETVKVLKSNNARWLNDYEDLVGKNILVKSDATLHPEQFDIQG
ncbi:MAG TPA: Rne/Rng family ribonuclease [Terracidiphilus sp.]|nr:Rne/Rng family ribonuclease [Terracidiphilus sp.]